MKPFRFKHWVVKVSMLIVLCFIVVLMSKPGEEGSAEAAVEANLEPMPTNSLDEQECIIMEEIVFTVPEGWEDP